jgi:hypothetical protein
MHRTPGRRKSYPVRRNHQMTWVWTSQNLFIPQQARSGGREYDTRHPACHYNVHVHPACGGLDYHNYHIRYLGARAGQHVWSVVDAPAGREQSQRVYTVSQECSLSEAIEVVNSLLASDITSDIGDPSLWLKLADHLTPILFDVYQHNRENTRGRRS